MVDEQILNIVKDYLALLKTEGISVTSAYLYGSYARGEATPESDIDLMLVSPLFDDDPIKFAYKIWEVAAKINYKIEPVTVGERRFWADESSPLIGIVRHEGIRVAA